MIPAFSRVATRSEHLRSPTKREKSLFARGWAMYGHCDAPTPKTWALVAHLDALAHREAPLSSIITSFAQRHFNKSMESWTLEDIFLFLSYAGESAPEEDASNKDREVLEAIAIALKECSFDAYRLKHFIAGLYGLYAHGDFDCGCRLEYDELKELTREFFPAECHHYKQLLRTYLLIVKRYRVYLSLPIPHLARERLDIASRITVDACVDSKT